jgi:hypothetical protein
MDSLDPATAKRARKRDEQHADDLRSEEVLMLARATVLACLLWVFSPIFDAAAKPTRSQCIIGFDLEWSAVSHDRNEVRNAMDWPTGNEAIESLAAMAISMDGERLYLQFIDECHRKAEMADTLIQYWRSEGLDLPNFERIEDTIVPAPGTIDAEGPYWSD